MTEEGSKHRLDKNGNRLDAKWDRLDGEIRKLAEALFEADGIEGLSEGERRFRKEAARLREAAGRARPKLDTDGVRRERYPGIIGDSPAMMQVFALLDRVAPASVPVLIQGESGTGKELIARAIHHNSPRKDREYVAENCAAIPETLLESELFGYRKGAFTGADRNKRGLFEIAEGGTIFLDEIGDMSINMQKKLLRTLQDGEIRPVGCNEVIHVDVRLVSASNKNLRKLVEEKSFREDLFFRLNTITVVLPPLRERTEDISALSAYFLTRVGKELNTDPARLSEEALDALKRYRWPGNVRELENEMRRCLALKGDGDEIGLDDLSEDVKNCY